MSSAASSRAMKLSDLDRVGEMIRTAMEAGLPTTLWTDKQLRRHFLQASVTGWVLEQAGEIVGAQLVRLDGAILHIDALVVLPGWSRRGYGTQLLEQAHEYAQGLASRCELLVRDGNKSARKFYARHGYLETSRIDKYYCAQEDAIQMSLDVYRLAGS